MFIHITPTRLEDGSKTFDVDVVSLDASGVRFYCANERAARAFRDQLETFAKSGEIVGFSVTPEPEPVPRRLEERPAFSATHIHGPSGRRCSIVAHRSDGRVTINLGGAADPFPTVPARDVLPIVAHSRRKSQ